MGKIEKWLLKSVYLWKNIDFCDKKVIFSCNKSCKVKKNVYLCNSYSSQHFQKRHHKDIICYFLSHKRETRLVKKKNCDATCKSNDMRRPGLTPARLSTVEKRLKNSCFIDNCVFKEMGKSWDYPFFHACTPAQNTWYGSRKEAHNHVWAPFWNAPSSRGWWTPS